MGRMSMAYGIQLPGGLQLEAYLTPGHAGADTLHVTFTDQHNAPIALKTTPVVTFHSATAAGTTRNLAMRPLGASPLARGQYLGTAAFAVGRWQFHVSAVGPDGRDLGADVVLSVT